MNMDGKVKMPRKPGLGHALISFGVLVGVMALSIIKFGVDVHVPMFCGVIISAAVALYLGYKWDFIERAMMNGIYNALQAVIILMIVGILVGIWVVAGVVPAMIYFGLKLLSPSIFLVAALLICSITSLATGTSWGTMGTMGLALIGIATGLGIPPEMAAGAIISGAYFGDKMTPMSDTTNLAPAMAGTDVITHVKFMLLPTGIVYGISIVVFLIMGISYSKSGQAAGLDEVQAMSEALSGMFNINIFLLIPPLLVIVLVAFKVPAIPGITAGIIAGAILGVIFQHGSCGWGELMDCGMNGYVCETGNAAIDSLLSTGGINNMLFSVSLTIIAMMFGGIMEETGQLQAVVSKIMKLAKTPKSLVVTTEATCILSNAFMPEQYISIVVPGRMYQQTYKNMGLHPKTLSNALESAGTVTSALIPWNTCGVFILATLGVSTFDYLPYAIFNLLMPITVAVMAFMGLTIADKDGYRMTKRAQAKKAADIESGAFKPQTEEKNEGEAVPYGID
ncbi:MAG: Na+/H+ antiporter NhaC [Firmicutes bacterium]|nr:Na+/H+ antiporter NhaC [Bacillota bacterium]